MTRVALSLVLGSAVFVWAQGRSFGQDSDQELRKEVEELKKTVADLQEEVKAKPPPRQGLPISLAEEEVLQDRVDPINKWIKEIKLSGFVDVAYTQNFNNPHSGTTQGNINLGRFFDTQSNSFMVNMAELMFEKVASKDSPTGIRLKLGAGKDAGVLAGTENFGTPVPTNQQFDIVEAYAEYLAPIARGFDFKIGKMATLAGYEVIESKDNFNYSRSFLFTYAIPLTHTGARVTYSFIDQLSATIGIVNGWNVVLDPNQGKTFEGQISANPTDWLSMALTGYYGAEDGAANGPKRGVVDWVTTATIKEIYKIGFNFDYGDDQALNGGRTDAWIGAAIYGRVQVSPLWAPGLRLETFKDNHGGAAPFVIVETGLPAGGITLNSFTLTNEFAIGENLVLRPEIRADHASKKIYQFKGDTVGKQDMVTLAFEAIFKF
jgi:hypothetical protein